MKKNKKLITTILIISFIISGCNLSSKENKTKKILNQKKENIINVKTYKVMPKIISDDISLSGVTQPLDEVMISPKMSSKVVGIYAKEGDAVKTGQTLIQLEQDQTLLVAYNNAQAGLTNIVATTNQDINSAELAVTTAKINLNNTKINTEENIRNAELAVSAAKLVVENSKKSVDNTKNASEQTIQNTYDSIRTTMQSNLSTINVALTAIGDIIGEKPGNVNSNDNYEDVLGVTNTQSLTDTKSLFLQSKNDYEIIKNNYDSLTSNSSFNEIDNAVSNINNSLNLIKQTLNQTNILLDNTIICGNFTTTNLSALKTSINTNLTSINIAISALQANEQAIINAKLADTSNNDNARSAYDAAESNLEIAEQALILAQSQGKTQIDSAKKQLEAIQANLKNANSRSKLQISAAQGQLNSVQAQLNNTTIISPISGTLNQILIDSGEMAIAGKPIASIVNISGIKIELSLTEFDIGQVSVGQDAKIALAAYPNNKFTGQIYYVSLMADAISKKFPIKIQLDNKDGKIKAGMVAQVNIITAKQKNILVIPKSAVFIEDGIEKVYSVDKNLIIKIKNVKTEIVNDEELKIIEGLIEGDKIVIKGNYKLEEGDKINIEI